MMQLFGFSAVELADARSDSGAYTLTCADASDARTETLAAYEQRALTPIVDALNPLEVRYLQAMAACVDDDLEASTASVAAALGKEPDRLTYCRDQLIRNGIIVAAGRGKVRFAIPFLRQFVAKGQSRSDNERLLAEWRV